jgi:chromosome segregation ATPase
MTVKEEGPCKVNRSMIRCQDMPASPNPSLFADPFAALRTQEDLCSEASGRADATRDALDAALKRAAEAEKAVADFADRDASLAAMDGIIRHGNKTISDLRTNVAHWEQRATEAEALAEARLRTIEGHLSNLADRDATIEVLRDHLTAADELAVSRGKEAENRDATIAGLRASSSQTALLHELRNALVPLKVAMDRGAATLDDVAGVVNRLLVFADGIAKEERGQ